MSTASIKPPSSSPWAPLKNRLFCALWIATVASNVGTWMNDVGATWMMTTLNSDPLMVALVQAAGSLPMFLFALPSGVLADIVDRRKYMIFAQIWMLIVALTLGVLALTGMVTPIILLATAFLLSTGAAMSAPAFQAVVPDLVPKSELGPAIALNSLGINISRAIGPALGGFILSFTGPAAVFFLNALSVLGVIVVLYRWENKHAAPRLPPEHFLPAIRVGVRYVQAAPVLRNVMVRAVAFFLFGSAGWALLPLIARQEIGVGPGGYGLLLTSIGLGAVFGALTLPKLNKKLSADAIVVLSSVIFALVMFAMAYVRSFWVLAAALLPAGWAWISVLSTMNYGAQRSSAGWVKARALAAYLTVFYGAMTAGSVVWGQTASMQSTTSALIYAGVGMLLAVALTLGWRLAADPELNLDLSASLPGHTIDVEHDKGPIQVAVTYRVDTASVPDFIAAVREMRRVRRRVGALSWGIYEDLEVPGRFVEVFVVESWLDHLRQHERHTMNDKLIRDRVLAFHIDTEPPTVEHMVAR